ncbi:MAG: 16S rRNA (guanine(966)-N(2))-methyltransferase RsmD [Kiritimatiellia bacterium]
MRISGGEMCGRKLKVPPGDNVRPTQDRVREALFSMVMTAIPDAVFIDLFAGSGAVGLEAYSRGARSVTWVERDPRNVAVLKENVAALMPGAGEVGCCEVARWLNGAGRGRQATLIFADPPYAVGRDQGFADVMRLLRENRVLSVDGLFVAEMPESRRPDEAEGWALLRDRVYGHTRLAIYRMTGAAAAG